jgi:hypothetical protein
MKERTALKEGRKGGRTTVKEGRTIVRGGGGGRKNDRKGRKEIVKERRKEGGTIVKGRTVKEGRKDDRSLEGSAVLTT